MSIEGTMPPRNSGSNGFRGTGSSKILTFFKPISQPPPHTPPQTSGNAAPTSTSSSPYPPPSPLSRTTPKAQASAWEIAASDEDDSDGCSSNGSLEDLSALLGRGRPTAILQTPQKLQHDPYATPRAKRTAVAFYSSPLAIMPRHKFDMKALAKDARRDDATMASSIRARAAADETEQKAAATENVASGEGFLEIIREKGGQDAQRVLRAVQRSETGQSQLRYCFFDPDYSIPSSTKAPKQASIGPWSLLTQGSAKVRELHLASGVPQTMIRMMNNLPDSLLQWILDELCIQKSAIMRQEYCSIVADCSDQVERLLTPKRLHELFIRLGANEEPKAQGSKLSVSNLAHDPYQDRDWSPLRSFLWLLGSVSRSLSVPAAKYATRTLLRMSMDKFLIYDADVLMEYESAIQCLADAIPNSSWDSFCHETCLSLHSGVKSQNMRTNALLCLPVRGRRTHDLRRRLAIVFLFDDPALARHGPEDIVAINGIIDLVDGDDFTIHSGTDFVELKASIILLDMAVDDGSAVTFDDRNDEARFNDQVDELASRLRNVWRKINDSGMKLARTEAKCVVEWVQQRLSNMVRTRNEVKKSVFDPPSSGQDPFPPRLPQAHMRAFLQKRPKSPTEKQDCIHVATS